MAESNMDKESKGIAGSTLTLNPDENTIDSDLDRILKTAEAPKMDSVVLSNGNDLVGEGGYSAGSVSESMLSDEEKAQVEDFCRQINLADTKQVNSYGASAQRNISTFSTNITSRTKTKEFGEIGNSLKELRIAIGSTTKAPSKSFLGNLFQKGKNKITYIVSNYQNAETSIKKIEKDLRHHQQTLTTDVFMFDEMYGLNLKYYKEITMYIIAGKKALDIARSTTLIELQEKANLTQDQMDIQAYRDFENSCIRFEKKLNDLEVTRMISIQQAPQIRLLQSSDQELLDKLSSDIINTIPIWRNQMVLRLGIEHTKRALDAQSAVTEMTNEMLRQNAEDLKIASIDIAKESERPIVDLETIQKINNDIITSINEVVRIHEDGIKKRAEAEVELAKLEEELKQGLLEAGAK